MPRLASAWRLDLILVLPSIGGGWLHGQAFTRQLSPKIFLLCLLLNYLARSLLHLHAQATLIARDLSWRLFLSPQLMIHNWRLISAATRSFCWLFLFQPTHWLLASFVRALSHDPPTNRSTWTCRCTTVENTLVVAVIQWNCTKMENSFHCYQQLGSKLRNAWIR
jgi:hypothetical protein